MSSRGGGGLLGCSQPWEEEKALSISPGNSGWYLGGPSQVQGDCMPNAFRKHKVYLDGNKGHISCGFSVHIILGLRKVGIWKAELMLTVPVS